MIYDTIDTIIEMHYVHALGVTNSNFCRVSLPTAYT